MKLNKDHISNGCNYYIALDITSNCADVLGLPYFQFFLIENDQAFVPLVGALGNNVISWMEVILRDSLKEKLIEVPQ